MRVVAGVHAHGDGLRQQGTDGTSLFSLSPVIYRNETP
jgi:hypothetical protein